MPSPMNTPNSSDRLFNLELRIAKRADELVRMFGLDPAHALDQWRQAESEVWRDESVHDRELAHH